MTKHAAWVSVFALLAGCGLVLDLGGSESRGDGVDGGRLDARAPDGTTRPPDGGHSTDAIRPDGLLAADGAIPPDDARVPPTDAAATDAMVPADGAPMIDGGAGCRDSTECEPTEFCEAAPGLCASGGGSGMGRGTCVTVPMGCGAVYLPVCGCDGVTYSNDCMRQAAGVSYASDGECPPTCSRIPRTGCCFEDAHCTPYERCVGRECSTFGEGMCKPRLPLGQCWDDTDCAASYICVGAYVCPCGVSCFEADMEGTCERP